MRLWGHWDIDPTVKDVSGWISTVVTVILFMTPIETCLRIYKKKSVEQFKYEPYFSSFFNCALWVGYTIMQGNLIQAMVTNMIGAGLELVYVIIYFTYTTERRRMGTQFVVALVVAAVVVIIAVMPFSNFDVYSGEKFGPFIFGLLANIFNLAMYASPLAAMSTVVRTRSVEFMPLSLSLFTFFTACGWGFYGIYIGDVWITIPNCCGFVLAVSQLVLYSMYCRSTPEFKRVDDDYAKMEDPAAIDRSMSGIPEADGSTPPANAEQGGQVNARLVA